MSESGLVLTDAQGREKQPPQMGDPPLIMPDPAEFSDEVQQKMPVPVGYQILIAIPEIDEKTEGGLIKVSETIRDEEISSVVGFVLAIGPDAYADEEKFPSGPYCTVGDFVIFHAYSGTRIAVYGKEFRFINDDTVKAVVDDPRGIRRA